MNESKNKQILESYRNKFITRTRYGLRLQEYLQRSDCQVFQYREYKEFKNAWWLYTILPEKTRQLFDIHKEVPLLYVEFERVEPRILERMTNYVAQKERLERDIFILASCDRRAQNMVQRRSSEFACITLNLPDVGKNTPIMRNIFGSILPSIDYFEETQAIKNQSGFFGRSSETDDIRKSLDLGKSIGIFGLRKTGKTSLLYNIFNIRRREGKFVILFDLSTVVDSITFKQKLLQDIASGLLDQVDKIPKTFTLTRYGRLKSGLDDQTLERMWIDDLRTLLHTTRDGIELIIDEIDRIETRSLANDFQLLRGVMQTSSEEQQLVLLCAGVNPNIFNTTINPETKEQNLLYQLVSVRYLDPLTKDDSWQMIRTLGKRMGIRFKEQNLSEKMYEQYGGHPFLTRKACSLAVQKYKKNELPWYMEWQYLQDITGSHEENAPLEHAKQIFESFAEIFEEEAEIIRMLWSSEPEDSKFAEELVRESPQSIKHASSYGILEKNTLDPRIAIIKEAIARG